MLRFILRTFQSTGFLKRAHPSSCLDKGFLSSVPRNTHTLQSGSKGDKSVISLQPHEQEPHCIHTRWLFCPQHKSLTRGIHLHELPKINHHKTEVLGQ